MFQNVVLTGRPYGKALILGKHPPHIQQNFDMVLGAQRIFRVGASYEVNEIEAASCPGLVDRNPCHVPKFSCVGCQWLN